MDGCLQTERFVCVVAASSYGSSVEFRRSGVARRACKRRHELRIEAIRYSAKLIRPPRTAISVGVASCEFRLMQDGCDRELVVVREIVHNVITLSRRDQR